MSGLRPNRKETGQCRFAGTAQPRPWGRTALGLSEGQQERPQNQQEGLWRLRPRKVLPRAGRNRDSAHEGLTEVFTCAESQGKAGSTLDSGPDSLASLEGSAGEVGVGYGSLWGKEAGGAGP